MTATSSTVLVVEIQALGQLLAGKDAEIERLKILLIRAADALKEYRFAYSMYGRDDPLRLIQKLRKAAE